MSRPTANPDPGHRGWSPGISRLAHNASPAAIDYGRAATHDPLTALPNRALFLDRLEQAQHRFQRKGGGAFAVVLLALDNEAPPGLPPDDKAGDALLRLTTSRLRQGLRASDTVARVGGEEFALLLDEVGGLAGVQAVLGRLRALLSRPAVLDGRPVRPTASVGATLGPCRGEDPLALLREADIALRQARETGLDSYALFEPSMRLKAPKLPQIEAELRRGMERGEFEVLYQPILRLADHGLAGFEALLRWRRRGALVHPAEFLPAAEATGLILPLGRLAIASACRAFQSWRDQHPERDELFLCVNLSPRQFADPALAGDLAALLAATKLPARALRLEIPEAALMAHIVDSQAQAARLKALGLGLNIDDFGAGCSSLDVLRSLPLTALKIDRSLVRRLDGAWTHRAIARSVVELARTLGLAVIAEGVETHAEMTALADMGCDMAQGHALARPLPADHALRLILES